MKKHILTAVMLVLFAATGALAGTIHGIVRDADNNAVPGAVVYLPGDDNHRGVYVRTDRQGRFTIEGVAPGRHILFAAKRGFGRTRTQVLVRGREDIRVQIILPGEEDRRDERRRRRNPGIRRI